MPSAAAPGPGAAGDLREHERVDLAGIDIEWVRGRLERFVSHAAPQNQSTEWTITSRCEPSCGREQALALFEQVKPILERLYPVWRDETAANEDFEFAQERDAAIRLLSRIADHEKVRRHLGPPDTAPQVSASAMHRQVWSAAQAQWETGHLHEAVLAAAKLVNSLLQQKIDRNDLSEAKLAREAFSGEPAAPGRPRLRFAADDPQTAKALREGVMSFAVGCFSAIRHPLGHRPNEEVALDEQTALERLAALSLLARWIDDAELRTVEAPAT